MLQSIPFIAGVPSRARAVPSIRVVPRNARPVNNNNINPPTETQNQNRPAQSATAVANENEQNDATERTEGGDSSRPQPSESARNGAQNQESRSSDQGLDGNGPHFQYSMEVRPDWVIDSFETDILGPNEIADGK